MIYDILGFPSLPMDNLDSLVDSEETSFSLQNINDIKIEKLLSTKSESCGMNIQENKQGEFSGEKSQLVENERNRFSACRKESEQCIGICKCDRDDSSASLKRFKFQSDKDKIFEVIIFVCG